MRKIVFIGYGPIAKELMKRIRITWPNTEFVVLTKRKLKEEKEVDPKVFVSDNLDSCDSSGVGAVICSLRKIGIGHASESNLQKFLESLIGNVLLVNFSSVGIYGECKFAANETSPAKPINQYGKDKLYIEDFLVRQENINLVNLRISNVYGDHQFDDVVNKAISSILSKEVIKLSKPSSVFRDFISIGDVVTIANTILFDDSFRTGHLTYHLNVASGLSLSLRNLVRIIEETTASKLLFEEVEISADSIRCSRIDNSKLLGLKFQNIDLSIASLENYVKQKFKLKSVEKFNL